jgi:universal stress protein A
MAYSNILVAVDLSSESPQILERALELSPDNSQFKHHLYLVHVLEPLALAYGADSSINLHELQQQLESQALIKFTALAKKYSIPLAACHILLGSAAGQIHDFAARKRVDLIVVGSHGRSGLALLLGSTANAVLHGANCDVLAVRVRENQLSSSSVQRS